ncbi:MAG TPA: ABC transporter ATP-binding protein [Coriobacteriia bacterium]|nr:ABC transporter ATP-binding protein [Coriobacteriia bacterium]
MSAPRTGRSNTVLKVTDVKTCYGKIEALRGISVEVHEGEIVTLIGANGAGKSTTLKTISGQLTPNAGTIEFQEEKIAGVPAHKVAAKGIVQVPEGRRIFSRMTVLENLEMGAYLRNDKEGIASDLDRVFNLFPRLKERIAQKGGTLSGGEQQMLAMGRGLMAQPKLLMLDEPSMGLAPVVVETIFEIIGKLNNDGITILLVEQNANLALSIADRGYVLETGEIKLSGTGAELLANDEVRKAYLGES